MLPGRRRMLNHCGDSHVKLVVLLMELDCFRPHLPLFTGSDQSWDVKSVAVLVDVVHESLWLVFCIHDTNICEDTVVRLLMCHSLFQEIDELLNVAELFIVLDDFLQVIWVNDDIESTNRCRFEFSSSHA